RPHAAAGALRHGAPYRARDPLRRPRRRRRVRGAHAHGVPRRPGVRARRGNRDRHGPRRHDHRLPRCARPRPDARPRRATPRARLSVSPTPILLVSAVFTVYSLAALPSVRFDYNRLHLQARGTESAIWEQRIVASRRSGFAALTTAESAADLRAKQAAFERLP